MSNARTLLQQALDTLDRHLSWNPVVDKLCDDIRAALAAPQVKQEPVAWIYENKGGAQVLHHENKSDRFLADKHASELWPDVHRITPLYADPPAPTAVPLPPPELTWIYTHCRAIGMTRQSESGKWEHDIALFTVDMQDEIKRLKAAAVPPDDVGLLEYQGNSVSFIYAKMRAYRDAIDNAWNALRSAGVHPNGQLSVAEAISLLAATADQPAAVPPGHVVVPVEPTYEINKAIRMAVRAGCFDDGIYRAMLTARPGASARDCRTCAHHRNCLNTYPEQQDCVGGNLHEPLPPVRLWRTEK